MKLRRITLILLCFVSIRLVAQERDLSKIEEIINDIFEQYSAESGNSPDYESFYADLISLADAALDLNTAKKEQLEKLVFLSDLQIENLQAYIYSYGQLNSLFELKLVPGFDMTDIRRMLPFVRLGAIKKETKFPEYQELVRKIRSSVIYRMDGVVEKKDGYKHRVDSSGNITTPYAGNPLYHSLRVGVQSGKYIQANLTAEKDAGEPFWSKTNKIFDSFSGVLQINNLGRIKTLILGDFKANFGQGLVVNNGYSVSPGSYVLNVNNRESGLRKSTSTNEFSFFRGAGCTVAFGKTNLSAFYSFRKYDADTTGGCFSSFDEDGYHRTNTERERRNAVSQQVVGLNAHVFLKFMRLGLTAMKTTLDVPRIVGDEVYKRDYFEGKNQTTVGLDYRFRWQSFGVFGETARTSSGGWATVNGIIVSPVSRLSLVSLWRNYLSTYDTFHANAFTSGSKVNNETGIYTGVEMRPFKYWKISAYADSYRFPWLKYGVSAPSTGMSLFAMADYTPKRNLSMNWRIKSSRLQKNVSDDAVVYTLYTYRKISARYQLIYNQQAFRSKNLLEFSFSDSSVNAAKFGFAAYQEISYSFRKLPLSVDVRCMYFDSPSYDTRFYLYESDVLYAFSIPMYYGSGMRYFLNAHYAINRSLDIWCKWGQTVYSNDKKEVGSGYEAITGNQKSEWRVVVRYSFR